MFANTCLDIWIVDVDLVEGRLQQLHISEKAYYAAHSANVITAPGETLCSSSHTLGPSSYRVHTILL